MRKIIVSVQVSLDGVQENPQNFVFDYANEEFMQYASSQLTSTDALIMGWLTYEGFAEAWGSRSGDAFTDRMNSLPKYVASRTLSESLTWNASLLKGDIAKEVTRLKQQPGQDILQYGVGELTHTLLQHGLVDEIRLLVYPVSMGSGARILENMGKIPMRLLQTTPFTNGVVVQHYQQVKRE